jgi:hypothetical protein
MDIFLFAVKLPYFFRVGKPLPEEFPFTPEIHHTVFLVIPPGKVDLSGFHAGNRVVTITAAD